MGVFLISDGFSSTNLFNILNSNNQKEGNSVKMKGTKGKKHIDYKESKFKKIENIGEMKSKKKCDGKSFVSSKLLNSKTNLSLTSQLWAAESSDWVVF